MNLYFETSAVNYLYDKVFTNSDIGSIQTKELQVSKARKWQISIITLWEIFFTNNAERRRDLFDFSRCLFYDDLIPTPEELITNYIRAGCPIEEKRYELRSKGLFSGHWQYACTNLDYFFEPEPIDIKSRNDAIRKLANTINVSENGYLLNFEPDFTNYQGRLDKAYLSYIQESVLQLTGSDKSEELKVLIAVTLQLTLIILCYGIGVDQPSIERFWNERGNPNPMARLEYCLNDFPDIFFRGPIANIAKMTISQNKGKRNRGLHNDSLHSIYVTYSDLFVTNDKHFSQFLDENLNDINTDKIMPVKEIDFHKDQYVTPNIGID